MNRILKGALLAGSIIGVQFAQADAISGTVDTTVALSNSYFVYNVMFGGGDLIQVDSLGSFGVGHSTFTIPDPGYMTDTSLPYAFLATYMEPTGAMGAVVSMNGGAAFNSNGVDFSTVFGEPESQLVNDLTGPFTDDLIGFYNTNMGDFDSFGLSAPAMGFSGGTRVGTVFAAVPEPAPFAALGLGVLALVRRRRVRS